MYAIRGGAGIQHTLYLKNSILNFFDQNKQIFYDLFVESLKTLIKLTLEQQSNFWGGGIAQLTFLNQPSQVQILTPQNVLNGYSGVALRQVPVKDSGLGDSIAQRCAYLLLDPAAPGLFPSIPKIFLEEKIINVDEVNQRRR